MKSKISIHSGFLLLLTFITISCSKNNDWARNGLHGKVKSINEKYYAAEKKFGAWTYGDSNSYALIHSSFTDKGVYNGAECYDDNGNLNIKIIPNYKEGKLIDESHYNQDGKLIDKTKTNQISEEVIETISLDENGRKKGKGKCYYKNNLFIGSDVDIFENDKPTCKRIRKIVYDSNGNVQSDLFVDEKGNEVSYKRYEYLEFDKKKNWTKSITFSSRDSNKPENFIIREIEYY